MNIRLNTDLLGFKSGQEITIKDKGGIPLDLFWRNRLSDAKIDNCITVVEPVAKSKSAKKEVKEND